MFRWFIATALGVLGIGDSARSDESPDKGRTVHDFTVRTIDGEDFAMKEYAGGVLMIVNVASK